MSEANVELVAEMYRAFHGERPVDAMSYFSDDVVVDVTSRVDGGTGRGRDDLTRIIGQWLGMFDDWHEEIEQVRGTGDLVCVVAVQHGRGKDSGIEAQMRYAIVYEVRDSTIAAMTLYRDPAEAFEAAGLRD